MPKFKDLINQQINNWKVLKRLPNIGKSTIWLCECKCGIQKPIYATHLHNNVTKMCRKCTGIKHKDRLNTRLWGRIRWSAKSRNLKFNLTKDYLYNLFYKIQKCKCSLSGITLKIANTTYNVCKETTASLDRIDSSKGYIKGNVQWIHKDINIMKNNLKEIDFLKYCKVITQYKKL